MLVYALTIFIGAFLLFQVQPLIGKYILPWFGGGTGVWTTCMLFFQVLLLGGYAYAHLLSGKLKSRGQVIVHLVLLLGAVLLLPITPSDAWKPRGDGDPTLQILVLLTVCLGLPYFVLSSTGPLMQQWFSRTHPGVSPYRLYALSNVGSLLALVSYPFFFESNFTRVLQAQLWGWGLVVYVVLCGSCALKLWRSSRTKRSSAGVANSPKSASPTSESRPATLDRALWLLLPACASALLLATTNKLCQDVAVVPFLWVLPLGLYLLTFIISFDSPRWYRRGPFGLALVVAISGLCWVLFNGADLPIRYQIGMYAFALFVCCMVCHGELYQLRPDPRRLTEFYLMIAAGGALGGLFVAVGAPLLFKDYYEMHWAILLCGFLFVTVSLRERNAPALVQWRWLGCALTGLVFVGLHLTLARLPKWLPDFPHSLSVGLRVGLWVVLALLVTSWFVRKNFREYQYWRLLTCLWLIAGWLVSGAVLWIQVVQSDGEVVSRSRNFYGTLTVTEFRKDEPEEHYYQLLHGHITHGLQFRDPARARRATTYYGEGSGVALAIEALPAGNRRIGMVGLGTGTIAAYGRPGDELRIYEINRDVQRLAQSRFTYLSNSPARIEIVLGDARLSLEREPPQNFDLLALDAFSSDAIPVHLLTKEAFELYARHVKTNGIIAVHISNQHLDLEPVIVNLARHFNYQRATVSIEETEAGEEPDHDWWIYPSTWVLLTHNDAVVNAPAIKEAASATKTNAVTIPFWTDDFASLFQIMQ